MLVGFLALAAAAPAHAEERRYTISSFDRIQVDGPFEVTLATGRASSAVAVGSSQGIERLSLEVQGRTLRIRQNRSAWGGYPGQAPGAVKIAVSTHELRGAELSGPGSLAIDKARGLRFDLARIGSGRLNVGGIEADHLVVGMMGSGRISIAGKAKELTATIKGSGDFDAKALTAEGAKINAETAGTISVGVRRSANVTSLGQGETTILGNPACTIQALGSGGVACGG